jgi:hypothetical protein
MLVMTTRPKRGVVTLLALAVLVSGCSGAAAPGDGVASLEGGTAATTTQTTQTPEMEEALFAFTECMRDNGVPMSDPSIGPDGNLVPGRPILEEGDQPDETFREALRIAQEACAEYLEGVSLAFGGFDDTEFQDALLAFAECLRDQGIDVADPDFSQEGIRRGPQLFGDGFDPGDSEVQAAIEACQGELPGGFGQGPGAPPPGGGDG